MKPIKQIIYILLIFISIQSCRQDSIQKIDVKNFPKGIEYQGKIKDTLRWKDKLGDNIAIITETGEYLSPDGISEDYRDAKLFAYHFLVEK